jgi:hypothetical protein
MDVKVYYETEDGRDLCFKHAVQRIVSHGENVTSSVNSPSDTDGFCVDCSDEMSEQEQKDKCSECLYSHKKGGPVPYGKYCHKSQVMVTGCEDYADEEMKREQEEECEGCKYKNRSDIHRWCKKYEEMKIGCIEHIGPVKIGE